MELSEKLNELRLKFPECRTLAFADISTEMILYASAEGNLRQEQLDALCGTATELLNGDIAERVSDALPNQDDTGMFQAIIIDPVEIGIFLKSTADSADALCCVCSPEIDLAAFIQDARENLTRFGQT